MSLFDKLIDDDDDFTAVQTSSLAPSRQEKKLEPQVEDKPKFQSKAHRVLSTNAPVAEPAPPVVKQPEETTAGAVPPEQTTSDPPRTDEKPSLFRKRPRDDSADERKRRRAQRAEKSQADAEQLRSFISKLKQ